MPANLTQQYLMAEARYRAATTHEEKVAALEEMIRVLHEPEHTEKMFADELKNEWSNVWVAEAGEPRRVVAFAVFWVACDEIHVLNVAVAPEERRRGHARLLLRSVLAFGEHRRMSHVVLEVRPSNLGAQRLYQSLDFRPVGVRPRYYQDNGEDAILMVRMLRR